MPHTLEPLTSLAFETLPLKISNDHHTFVDRSVYCQSDNNNNYILDIAPFNIKMIKSVLHEFNNINVYK